MKSFPVKLQRTEDVLDFVRIVNKFDGDVDLKSGSILIDAKSIMGAIALSGASHLELLVHEDNCEELVKNISPYLCA